MLKFVRLKKKQKYEFRYLEVKQKETWSGLNVLCQLIHQSSIIFKLGTVE